jgi:hypothetical protein
MKTRYQPRVRVRYPVIFIVSSHVGEGDILDLTSRGCLIESSVPVDVRQSLQLEVLFPGVTLPLSVMLGVVRWVKADHFAVEFTEMHESQQRILERYLASARLQSVD